MRSRPGRCRRRAPCCSATSTRWSSRSSTSCGDSGSSRCGSWAGSPAVSEDVAVSLRVEGFRVVRTSGTTRLETAVAIAELVDGADALLARAYAGAGDPTAAFADSLAAGAWSAQTGDPLLLTQSEVLSAPPRTALASRRPGQVVIVGGWAAVSEQVAEALDEDAHRHRRVSGADRAATAVAVAQARGFGPDTPARSVVLVDGDADDAWTRGLTAGAFSAANDAPIVLASGDSLPAATAQFLSTAVSAADGATVVWCAASPLACDAALAAIRA